MQIKQMLKKFAPLLLTLALILAGLLVVVLNNRAAFFPSSNTSTQGASKLDKDIAIAEVAVNKSPTNTKPYLNLASLYLQKVRETSDSAYYAKIDSLMDQAGKIDPKDGDVPAIRASVAMGRHDFRMGKTYIMQALALNNHTAAYYGLEGDADIELGLYTDSVGAFQKMIDIRPDFSSWSRIAYIRELYGDIPGAKEALSEAITSGSTYPENIAWAYTELGKLQIRDDLSSAQQSFEHALRVLPTYTQGMEGLGKVAFFKNDFGEAEGQFSAAYNVLALAQYAVDLGDLYQYQKNQMKAAQEYELAKVAFDTSIKGGVNTDLEESLFLSDHELDLDTALAMATRAHTDRPSQYGADYLSWALYKNDKPQEAAKYTKEALTLGEIDPLILFHQGMIALANHDTATAKKYLIKAKALNPHFSLQYSGTLETTLVSL